MNKKLWRHLFYRYSQNLKQFNKIDEIKLLDCDNYNINIKSNINKKPEPPVYPHRDDCCGSGCIDCVYIVYDNLYQKYEEKLLKWELENSDSSESNYQ